MGKTLLKKTASLTLAFAMTIGPASEDEIKQYMLTEDEKCQAISRFVEKI